MTDFVAILSLGVSIIALIVSSKTYLNEFRENLKISTFHLERVSYETKLIFKSDSYALLQSYWEVIIVNIGHKPVVLSNYFIQPFSQGEIVDIGKGLYNCENLQKLELPVKIEAGESAKFILIIGLPIEERPLQLLRNHFTNIDNISSHTLFRFLQQNEVDIFNNKLTPIKTIADNTTYQIQLENRRDPTFFIYFKTARGKKFHDWTFFYRGKSKF